MDIAGWAARRRPGAGTGSAAGPGRFARLCRVSGADKRQADLDWLYGGNAPSVHPVVPVDEHARAERAVARAQAEAARQAQIEAARQAARAHTPEATTPSARPQATPGRREEPAPRVRPHPAATAADKGSPASSSGAVPVRRAVRRHPFRWALLVIFLLIIAWIAYLVYVPVVVWRGVTTVDATPTAGVPNLPGDQPGTVILIVGSDSRDALTPAEAAQLGGPDDGGRTDTMMLLVIPKTGPDVLVSLPRDSYVPIPGHGSNKLNAAYAFGGPGLLVATVEQDTGVHIDDYVEMNMGGFADLVDAVDGVQVCLSAPIQDVDSQLNLPAGCQTLDGAQALGYARMRKADPLGDLGRVQRQRELIGKIADKAATPKSVLDPMRYWELGHAVGATLTRDPGMSAYTALQMGLAMQKLGTGKGLSLTVPVANSNAYTSAGSSVLWDDAKAAEMFSAIATGNTTGLEKFA